MAYEHRENSGSLFRNDKGDNPKRPDYRGEAMVDGVLREIAAWIKPKPSNPAEKYMTLEFKKKEQAAPKRPQAKPAPVKAGGGFDDMDNDIPF